VSERDGLPLADPGHVDMATELFREGLSPEEFAARYAHTILCFSLDDVRYVDPALDHWIGRLGDILFRRNGAPTVDELRARLLSPAERLRIEREEKEAF
jgi:hypothetical protein